MENRQLQYLRVLLVFIVFVFDLLSCTEWQSKNRLSQAGSHRDLFTDRRYLYALHPGESARCLGLVDLCVDDPGYDADVTFVCDLKTMTEIWVGDVSLSKAQADGQLEISGLSRLTRNLSKWLVFSAFAGIKGQTP